MPRDGVPIETIRAALRSAPAGLTTKQLAEKVGMSPRNLGHRLSKLFMYGLGVEREEHRATSPSGVTYQYFVWRTK
jgi:DNA-binding transcriptional ArsR family regulator